MTGDDARKRAREVASHARLGPEETATLLGLASRWTDLDIDALDHARRESLAAAEGAPDTPLRGAKQLLLTILREETIVAALDSDDAREAYVTGMHGYARPEPTPEEMAAVEAERKKELEKAAAAEAQRTARLAPLEALRKHPAMYDERHPEHDAVVQQLKKFFEE